MRPSFRRRCRLLAQCLRLHVRRESLLRDRGDHRVRECPQRRWWHREYGGRDAGRGPHELIPPETRIHDHPRPPGVAERRDPADDETGQIVRLAGRGSTDLRLARDRRQPRDVDAIRTGDQAYDRLQPVLLGSDEHERLHDLAELGAQGGSRLDGGVGGLGERRHFERDALALRGVQDALDRGMHGDVWHGAESSIGARGATLARSIQGVQAIVLADGDIGTRMDLDAAWPGWLEQDALVIAADGGARHAATLDLDLDRWVGDGDSLGLDGVERLRAAGIPVHLAEAEKDESDTQLAVRAALEAGADTIVILGALGGARVDHALANVGLLALPALHDVPTCLLDATARISLIAGPATRLLPGPEGATVSLLPQGDGVEGVTTEGFAYPLHDEPLPAGPARGLSNIRTATTASVTLRAGHLLVVEAPATLST